MSQQPPSTSEAIDFSTPIDYTLLKGKNALVTGGASGLGAGFATMLAASGANVVIADRNSTLGQALEAELTGKGHRAKFVAVDVSSWESQTAMLKATLAWFPKPELDIVVTSAGVAERSIDLTARDIASLESDGPPAHGAISVGLLGCYYTVTLALRYGMGATAAPETKPDPPRNLNKSITLVGSMAGFLGLPGNPDYAACKFGVRGLLYGLRGSSAVRVNNLTPFFIETPMTSELMPTLRERGVKFGKVEDAVSAVARFSTDVAVHGRVVCVNAAGLTDMGDDAEGGFGAKAMGVMNSKGIW